MNVIHYRPSNIRLSRYLVFCIRSEWVAGPHTLRPFLLKMTESLNMAFNSPNMFLNGERFIVAEFRGDQEFHRKIWQHSSHWPGVHVCPKCDAKSTGQHCLYTDLADDPDWGPTERSTMSFINDELPPIPCALDLSDFFIYMILKFHKSTYNVARPEH